MVGLEQNWLDVAVVVGGAIVLAWAIRLGSRYYLGQERTETSFGQAAFEEVHTPLSISIVLVGIGSGLLTLGLSDAPPVIPELIASVLVVLWARAAIRIGRRWIALLQNGETSYEFAPMFENLWTLTVSLGAVLLLVSIWDLELTPFLASAGIAGIVLGFAAQDAIGNLIGGVALYFDNTYKIGDVIHVEDDMRGTVTDVGIRSTTVLTEDNVLVTVPNAVLNSTEVVNESAPQRHMRLRIPISAAYGTDHELVEELVLEVCEECSLVRERPSPKLLFLEFGDSALEFELRVYVNHPLVEKRAIDQVNRGVYEAFDEAGITIPFPQRELSFLEDDDPREFQFSERPGDESGGADGANDSSESASSSSGGRADSSDRDEDAGSRATAADDET
ncbi:small-conductance mechanosensitive channel [Natrarchaeobaculum aegyptiacum]|uniref:Small-conductance mechanosensitive channel n=2 Tax=Natrarchaeobaculum aegyptiacum TaxID=745377 RepID=A0A2Z2HWX7_9EURY|nr:small-conductance mechanosensitive channel [Natrarchaeobaculum aegyptiacum]